MDKPLKGKVVVITGAGRGLGAALARAFAAQGASLVLASRTPPELEALAAELGASAKVPVLAVPTDVRVKSEVDALIDAAVGEFGQLDVMVNNAGLAIYGPVESITPDQLDLMIDTNLKGTIFGSQAAFRVMKPRRSGLIVNISSIAGKLHLPNESAYNASKWAVNGFTGTLRLEAEPHGVKVSCVCPGGIDTPFWKSMDFLPFPSHIDPERDFMKPEEVAGTVVQIALGSGSYVLPEVVMLPLITGRG
jgi:NAD(P)-dependent dehydrogenase (short-subunit alcohol dehydrogenase family)